jgi:hypothetical protein
MNFVFKSIVFAILLFVSNPFNAAAFQLSPQAEISVLTCSPGNEMYSVYGHTAIRIKDELFQFDAVYNYGIFDFSTPNFLYRFASGQTDYLLGAYNFKRFYEEYEKDKRSIFEQVLNLTSEEKQQVFDFLNWNAQPENRVYRYNFFFDNCASRVRDVIVKQTENEIIFPENRKNQFTFRDLIKEYHGKMLWLDFGIDLVVCAPADKPANTAEEMFLPDYLMDHFANAVIKRNTGEVPLVKSSGVIYQAPEQFYSESKLTSPFVVFMALALLLVYLAIVEFRNNKAKPWLDNLVYGITGFMGIIIFWFVMYSEHPAMHPNYNLMWAIPFNFLFVLLQVVKKWREKFKKYHVLVSVWLILFVGFSWLLPQTFHPAFYAFVLMVLSRSVLNTFLLLKSRMLNLV